MNRNLALSSFDYKIAKFGIFLTEDLVLLLLLKLLLPRLLLPWPALLKLFDGICYTASGISVVD